MAIPADKRDRIMAHIAEHPETTARILSTLYNVSYHTARRMKIRQGQYNIRPKRQAREWTPEEDALLDDDSLNPTDVSRILGITRSSVMARVRKLRRMEGKSDIPGGWTGDGLDSLSKQCSRGLTVEEMSRYFGVSCQVVNEGLRHLQMEPRDIFFNSAGTRYMRLNGTNVMCDYQGTRL